MRVTQANPEVDLYLVVSGAPLVGLLLPVPAGGLVRGRRGQFVQQISVQLFGLRQGDLQQETLHHQLLQLRTKCCNKCITVTIKKKLKINKSIKKTLFREQLTTQTLEWNREMLCVK